MAKYLNSEEIEGIQISEDVVVAIAAIAAGDVEGVVPIGAKGAAVDWKDLLPRKGVGKNVRVEAPEGKLVIDLDITVEYSKSIRQIAENVQKAVFDAVTGQTGLPVESVNIHVVGIQFPRKKAQPEQE